MLEANSCWRGHHVLPAVCRHQRSNLLLSQPIRDAWPRLRNAAPSLWHHKLHSTRWCSNQFVDDGSFRTPPIVARRSCVDVHLPPDHCRPGWEIRGALGGFCCGRLGRCRISILLHVHLGTRYSIDSKLDSTTEMYNLCSDEDVPVTLYDVRHDPCLLLLFRLATNIFEHLVHLLQCLAPSLRYEEVRKNKCQETEYCEEDVCAFVRVLNEWRCNKTL